MAASMMTTLSGSAVAAPASRLSSSAAVGSVGVQQFGIPRQAVKASRIVAVKASLDNEERSTKHSQVLVALVAAGAALALNAPLPANAGFFGGPDVKVERGATSPDFPGNEGTGTKVGENSGVRGAANSGTPLGEGAGGSKVGENSATRQMASTGTPLGEGRASGSGVSVPDLGGIAEKAKGAVGGGIPDVGGIAEKAKSAVGGGGLPDVGGIAEKAKDAVSGAPDVGGVAEKAKSAVNGAPDVGNVAEKAKSAVSGAPDVGGVAEKAKNAVSGADMGGVADKAKDTVGALPKVDPMKTKLGDFEAPDVAGAASDAKSTAGNFISDLKNKLPGGAN